MQFFAAVSALLAAATFVAAAPQTVGIIPSGEPCLPALALLCESGVCTEGTGILGQIESVRLEPAR